MSGELTANKNMSLPFSIDTGRDAAVAVIHSCMEALSSNWWNIYKAAITRRGSACGSRSPRPAHAWNDRLRRRSHSAMAQENSDAVTTQTTFTNALETGLVDNQ